MNLRTCKLGFTQKQYCDGQSEINESCPLAYILFVLEGWNCILQKDKFKLYSTTIFSKDARHESVARQQQNVGKVTFFAQL